MRPVAVAALMLVCVFGCALLGQTLRRALPGEHLSADARDVMKLALGLVATMAALVLGLLTASAKSAYDAENEAVMQSAANVILLDRTLAQYGPRATDIRRAIRQVVASRLEQVWPEDGAAQGTLDTPARAGESIEQRIRALSPESEAERELRTRAIQIADTLLGTRWMALARAHNSVPTIFLLVLGFWIGLLFGGFGLLAPPNATIVVVFACCAVAVGGSIFLILEMSDPLAGPMKISGAPLRYALLHLGQ